MFKVPALAIGAWLPSNAECVTLSFLEARNHFALETMDNHRWNPAPGSMQAGSEPVPAPPSPSVCGLAEESRQRTNPQTIVGISGISVLMREEVGAKK
jgi:hypothetical protein